MFNINKNITLNQLEKNIQEILYKKIDCMPEDFNHEMKLALELFQKRVFLEKTIDETISFNKQFIWENKNKNLSLATTAEDLLNVFKLRSNIYGNLNYQDEFPDFINGLNFDNYDFTSAIILYKSNGVISGTTRIIVDSENRLPIEHKFSLDNYRGINKTIAELSRLIVSNENKGLNLEFKYLMQGIYQLYSQNDLDLMFLVIVKEHYKLYSKFGGSEIIKEFDDYGNLGHGTMILSWDPSKVSKFFEKAFLK
ncbi:N-acyl amino acid synthase FeeM domain-containing protein [Poseidonibacter lekithochrous]|uniref:N-acyl amino acid synthase FeeM domain-containing protein n=1 Tax=Poseidonibacter lekithochrous TaxID=1904463 RepID=UPI0008FC4005|nr:hypothetical protein [Poseidonibacter lekithochrous]QKJ23290.1 hypothetical protein ALEK_2027 [Poseidonibacter lekithochrous]